MLFVESFRNGLKAVSVCVQSEDTAHDCGLGLKDREPLSALDLMAVIAEASASSVKAATNQTFKAATYALRRVAEKELVDHPAGKQEKLEFLVSAVDSLRDEVNFDPREAQALAEI